MRSAAFAIAALIGCGPTAPATDAGISGGEGADGGGGGPPDNEFIDAAPKKACGKIDFVFVVDNSGSMYDEQTNLGDNFPEFLSLIHNYVTEAGDLLDYRVALTTTSRSMTIDNWPSGTYDQVGEDGAFSSSCGMTRRWLERGDDDISQTFACIADVGTDGAGIEMPLLAVDWALNDRMDDGTNDGFLRRDALLAIVIVTDEEDCSQEMEVVPSWYDCYADPPELLPVEGYVQMLDEVKDQRGRWAAAVIAGPGPGTCSSEFGDAAEAKRLREFVQLTGDNAVFSSICEGDLSSPLADALDTFTEACEDFPPDID